MPSCFSPPSPGVGGKTGGLLAALWFQFSLLIFECFWLSDLYLQSDPVDAVRTREGGREGGTDRQRDSGQNVNPGVDSGFFCERGSLRTQTHNSLEG